MSKIKDMKLTIEQANKIAQSQKDLGGKSKEALVMRLTHEGIPFLDEITELIAHTIDSAENLDEAEYSLSYAIEQLTKAMVAVSSINK